MSLHGLALWGEFRWILPLNLTKPTPASERSPLLALSNATIYQLRNRKTSRNLGWDSDQQQTKILPCEEITESWSICGRRRRLLERSSNMSWSSSSFIQNLSKFVLYIELKLLFLRRNYQHVLLWAKYFLKTQLCFTVRLLQISAAEASQRFNFKFRQFYNFSHRKVWQCCRKKVL